MWTAATVVTTPTVGARQGGQRARSPRAGSCRSRRPAPRARGPRRSSVSGQTPLVVEARLGLQHAPARAEHRGHHLLRRRLAVRAGDGDDRDREPRAPGRAPDGRAPWSCRPRAPAARSPGSVGQRVTTRQDAPRAAASPTYAVAVEAVAADREEGVADRERAGVDRDPADGHDEVADDERALRRADDVLDGEGRHVASGRAPAAAPAGRPRGRRTAAPRRRRSGRSRAPCLRSPRCRPAAPTRARWRSPGGDRPGASSGRPAAPRGARRPRSRR